jgi:hypothetical protein
MFCCLFILFVAVTGFELRNKNVIDVEGLLREKNLRREMVHWDEKILVCFFFDFFSTTFLRILKNSGISQRW